MQLMNPENVYIYEKEGHSRFSYPDEFKVFNGFKDVKHISLSIFDLNKYSTFFIHNSSQLEIIRDAFPGNLFSDIINLMSRNYGYNINNKHNKCQQPTKDLDCDKLYVSTISVIDGQLMDISLGARAQNVENFNINDMYFVEIHNEDHIKHVYTEALKYEDGKSSHIILSFFFKARNQPKDHLFTLQIIEAMKMKEPSIKENLNNFFEEMSKIFTILRTKMEKVACLFYTDKTSNALYSNHVLKYLKRACGIEEPQEENLPSPSHSVSSVEPVLLSQSPPEGADLLPETTNPPECAGVLSSLEVIEDSDDSCDDPSLKSVNKDLKEENDYLQKWCTKLMARVKKEIEVAETKKTEAVEQAVTSYQNLLSSQQASYEAMLNETNLSVNRKVKLVTDFYKDKYKKKSEAYETLMEENKLLKQKINDMEPILKNFGELISNIHHMTTDKPLESLKPAPDVQLTCSAATTAPVVQPTCSTATTVANRDVILDLPDSVKLKQKEIDLENKISELAIQLKSKDQRIDYLECRLLVRKELHDESERAKNVLEAENQALKAEMNDICVRRNAQFEQYEKLIRQYKHTQQIDRHETHRLRQYIGSVNFSPARRQLFGQIESPTQPELNCSDNVTNVAIACTDPLEKPEEKNTATGVEHTPNAGSSSKRPRGRPRKVEKRD